MQTGQMLYLVLVIAAFAVFALVLAGASWFESSGRRKAAISASRALPQQGAAKAATEALQGVVA